MRRLVGPLREHDEPDVGPTTERLVALGASATRELLALLDDDTAAVRRAAATALTSLAEPGHEPRLAGALEDSDAGVRAAASLGLERLGWRATTLREALLATLSHPGLTSTRRFDRTRRLGEGTVPILGQLLAHSCPRLRRHCAELAGRLQQPVLIAPLMVALRDEDPQIAATAAIALGQLRARPAAAALAQAATAPDRWVSQNAAQALTQVAGREDADSLLVAAANPELGDMMAAALVRRGSTAITAAVASAPTLDRAQLRMLRTVLERLRPTDAPLAAWWALLRGDAEAAARASFSNISPLLTALNVNHRPIRVTAVTALTGLRDPLALEPLTFALEDEDPAVRRLAIVALERLNDPTAALHVGALRSDPDDAVRRAALEALAGWGDGTARIELASEPGPEANAPPSDATLDTVTDTDLTSDAAREPAELQPQPQPQQEPKPEPAPVKPPAPKAPGPQRIVTPPTPEAAEVQHESVSVKQRAQLLARLGDPQQRAEFIAAVRAAGARGLGMLVPLLDGGTGRDRAMVAEALRELSWRPMSNEEAAWFAAGLGDWATLASLGDAALPMAKANVEDEDARIRMPALEALAAIAGDSATQLLAARWFGEPEPALAERAWSLLVSRLEPPFETLTAGTREGDADIRAGCLAALAAMTGPAAVDLAIHALAHDEAPLVRRAAARAVRALTMPDALDALAAALNDSDLETRYEVIAALGELAIPESVEPLILALGDSDADARQLAAQALGQHGETELAATGGDPGALAELPDPRLRLIRTKLRALDVIARR